MPQSFTFKNDLIRGWIIDFLVSLMLTLWYYRSLIKNGFGGNLLDQFDNRSFIWALEWLNHSTFGNGRFFDLLDSNIFYPHQRVGAWSDMLLGYIPIYGGIRLFIHNPIFAFNLSSLIMLAMSVLGIMRLGRSLTNSVSIIAPLIGCIGLVSSGQEGHFQMKAIGIVVWIALAMLNYAKTAKIIYFTSAVVLWTFLFHCSVYLALMTFYLTLMTLLFQLVIERASFIHWLKQTCILFFRPLPLIATVVTFAPVILALSEYLNIKTLKGIYSIEEAVLYSGRLLSVFDAPSTSFLFKPLFSEWGSHEAKLMMGILAISLAFLSFFLPNKREELTLFKSTHRILGFIALLSLVLAFGPYEKELFNQQIRFPLLGWIFWSYLPGFTVMRTAGRFVIITAVCVGLLAQIGVARILEMIKPSKFLYSFAYIGLICLVGIEQYTIFKPYPTKLISNRKFYEKLDKALPKDAVIVELPFTLENHFDTMTWFIDQELASTIHWRSLVIGYSSKSSAEIGIANAKWQEIIAQSPRKHEFFDYLSSLGVTHVIIDRSLMSEQLITFIRSELISRGSSDKLFGHGKKEAWKLNPKS